MLGATDYILLFALGALGAFVAGYLGVGGGIIFIPILDFFLKKLGISGDVLVKAILANSLFTIIFTGLVATYKQYKLGNFFPREILHTALPGCLTAVAITFLIKSGSWYSKDAFNYVFGCMLLVIVYRMLFTKPNDLYQPQTPASRFGLWITGLFTGAITALSGLGGGIVMAPIFTQGFKMDIRRATAISNGVIPLLAIAVGIFNLIAKAPVFLPRFQVGYIALPVVMPMIIASFVFAPLGVLLSQRSSPSLVKAVFVSFVSLILIKTIYEICL
ncbi:MAG: sulfite exporter TauE/SafE family protein [Bacteroidia bacterium]|jgi:uncharacterized membrane protein YfcA|nr:sulfite exporter TauE/SafE family protein [Bacteroidia bacterium]